MPSLDSSSPRSGNARPHAGLFALPALSLSLVTLAACGTELPTDARTGDTLVASARLAASPAGAEAPVQAWHQGFEAGVAGWYDAGTDGALGWCGSIQAVGRGAAGGSSAPRPSAGSAYAEILSGPCNGYWSTAGIPGGAPYAPGPEAAFYTGRWPAAGYVSELDVYLDPSWSRTARGVLGLTLPSTPYPDAVLQLAATIMPADYQLGTPHPAPHWFASVEAVPGEEALSVFGHRIEEAGWYTFRFLLGEEDGELQAAFELRGRTGPVLVRVDPLPAQQLAGPFQVPFAGTLSPEGYGPGHLWFFDAPVDLATFAPLAVAIDEHRVRPGR